MGETPHELEQEISRSRTHIDEDLLALRRRAHEEIGRRVRFWARPLTIAGVALAGAFMLGFLLGRAFRS